jgi:nitrate/nitrite transporter NarK
VVWGVISSAFRFVSTPMQFYVMRFLLGVGEAGFFPGIILYLTYWMLERRWHIPIPGICAGLGLVVAAWVGSSPAIIAMIALTVTTAGSLCISPTFWSLPTAFLSGSAAAGSIALINSFGALGGCFGPYLVGFVKDLTGKPTNALYILAGFFFLVAVLAAGVLKAAPKPAT